MNFNILCEWQWWNKERKEKRMSKRLNNFMNIGQLLFTYYKVEEGIISDLKMKSFIVD